MGQHFKPSLRVYALKIPFLRTLFFFTCVNAPSQKHVSGNQPLERLLKLTSFGFMLFKFYAAEALILFNNTTSLHFRRFLDRTR